MPKRLTVKDPAAAPGCMSFAAVGMEKTVGLPSGVIHLTKTAPNAAAVVGLTPNLLHRPVRRGGSHARIVLPVVTTWYAFNSMDTLAVAGKVRIDPQ